MNFWRRLRQCITAAFIVLLLGIGCLAEPDMPPTSRQAPSARAVPSF